MKLPALLVSDIHLTEHPDDAYRWSLFAQMRKVIDVEGVRTVGFLGDTTDSKDYHSATLVNRVTDELVSLRNCKTVEDVLVLMGNHDYLKDGQPFLSFLNHIPGLRYITKPHSDMEEDGPTVLWLPHTRSPAKDWAEVRDVSWYTYVFMHQTVSGSDAGRGVRMGGDGSDSAFAHWGPQFPQLWSGDIHVPQRIKTPSGAVVNYVGSPYHVHFGDDFAPRSALLVLPGGKVEDVPMSFPSRYSIKVRGAANLRRHNVQPGDQVKVELILQQSEAHEWLKHKAAATAWAERCGVVLADLSMRVDTSTRRRMVCSAAESGQPEDVVREFVEREELGATAFDEALEFLK